MLDGVAVAVEVPLKGLVVGHACRPPVAWPAGHVDVGPQFHIFVLVACAQVHTLGKSLELSRCGDDVGVGFSSRAAPVECLGGRIGNDAAVEGELGAAIHAGKHIGGVDAYAPVAQLYRLLGACTLDIGVAEHILAIVDVGCIGHEVAIEGVGKQHLRSDVDALVGVEHHVHGVARVGKVHDGSLVVGRLVDVDRIAGCAVDLGNTALGQCGHDGGVCRGVAGVEVALAVGCKGVALVLTAHDEEAPAANADVALVVDLAAYRSRCPVVIHFLVVVDLAEPNGPVGRMVVDKLGAQGRCACGSVVAGHDGVGKPTQVENLHRVGA